MLAVAVASAFLLNTTSMAANAVLGPPGGNIRRGHGRSHAGMHGHGMYKAGADKNRSARSSGLDTASVQRLLQDMMQDSRAPAVGELQARETGRSPPAGCSRRHGRLRGPAGPVITPSGRSASDDPARSVKNPRRRHARG